MTDHTVYHNMLENVILTQLRKYPDGLSVEHLQSALEMIDADGIQTGLNGLLEQQRVIQGSNGWWYPARVTDEEIVEEVAVETEEPEPIVSIEKPVTLRTRLLEWLDSRAEGDGPVPLGELAEMFGTHRKTMNNTILVVSKKLPKEKADKLRASVLKQAQPFTLKKTFPAKLVASVAPVEAAGGNWIGEVRQCLRQTLSALPAPQKRQEWRDTLVEIERLFGELGVAEQHRSRVDLREISVWLSQD